ncbi:MAG: LLM class F420-dependent oxidoreductase [Candidatus Rokubacteria bacterium]|nr:LLM class F420-dependent oxidoreductase [Candidatus Rokubacteria bacterium]
MTTDGSRRQESSAPLAFGYHLPIWGPAATRETLIPLARRVEALGFDSVWASDHVVIPIAIASKYPYNATGQFPLPPDTTFLEPLTALALVAGVTERLRLGTTVLVLPHRHPVLAAKMLATLDHLAPGRVILGAGVGWMREEIELLGAPFAQRGAWTDEAIRIMRACWRESRVSFRGRFFSFPEVGFAPRPAAGTIPIWIGGHTPRAMRRVAELGDGWHAAFATPAVMREGIAALREACETVGRDPAALALSVRLGLSAKRPAGEVRDELLALRELGVSHVIVETRVADVADMTRLLERFVDDVRSKL